MELNRPLANVKVIGVGGAGCEVIRRVKRRGEIPGVAYLAIDAGSQQTARNRDGGIVTAELLPADHTSSWDRDTVTKAARDPSFVSRLKQAISDADVVVMVAGMGGATGTGVSPDVAGIARETGAFVLPIVTMPRPSEGKKRNKAAEEGISCLRTAVRNVVVVSQYRIIELGSHNNCGLFPFVEAETFLVEGICSIIELIAVPGEINVDLNDFRRVMGIPGVAVMCRGESRCTGSNRNPVLEATEWALGRPTADIQLKGAEGVLVNFCGNSEVATAEYVDALDFVRREVNPNVDWAFGVFEPEGVGYDCVRVTLIATGLQPRGLSWWQAE